MIHKFFKEVIEKEFYKASELMRSNVEDKNGILQAIAKLVNRKAAGTKAPEENITKLEKNKLNEGKTFETRCKTNLNIII